MVLQPVLENAVWHGMMSVKRDGLIEVNTKYSGNILQIIVSDNGAGLKTQVTSPHKSYGLAIVKEKLSLIEKMHGISGSLTIANRENENGVVAVFSFENLKPDS